MFQIKRGENNLYVLENNMDILNVFGIRKIVICAMSVKSDALDICWKRL